MPRVIFMGTGEIGLPAFRWLLDSSAVVAVVTQPDKPVGRRQELQASAIKQLAIERGVPVLQPVNLRVRQAAELVRRDDLDPLQQVVFPRLALALADRPADGHVNEVEPGVQLRLPAHRARVADAEVFVLRLQPGEQLGARRAFERG